MRLRMRVNGLSAVITVVTEFPRRFSGVGWGGGNGEIWEGECQRLQTKGEITAPHAMQHESAAACARMSEGDEGGVRVLAV